MNEIVCLICYESSQAFALLPCLEAVCSSCFVKSLNFTQKDIQIRCPGGCDKSLDAFQILKISTQLNQQDTVSDLLTMHYVKNQGDIRVCPQPKCNYYGILPEIKCNNKIICDNCGTPPSTKRFYKYKDSQWICPDLLTNSNNIFKTLITQHSLFMNHWYKFTRTRSCPRCQISIFKTGGCLHMTCQKCQYEFCWLCYQHHQTHNNNHCFIHIIIYYSIIMNFFFNILVYFETHITIWEYMLLFILFLMNLMIHNSLGCAIYSMIYYGISRLQVCNVYYKKRNQDRLIVSSISMVTLSSLIYFFTEITVYSWFMFLLYEAIFIGLIAGSGFSVGFCLYHLDQKWMRHVI